MSPLDLLPDGIRPLAVGAGVIAGALSAVLLQSPRVAWPLVIGCAAGAILLALDPPNWAQVGAVLETWSDQASESGFALGAVAGKTGAHLAEGLLPRRGMGRGRR